MFVFPSQWSIHIRSCNQKITTEDVKKRKNTSNCWGKHGLTKVTTWFLNYGQKSKGKKELMWNMLTGAPLRPLGYQKENTGSHQIRELASQNQIKSTETPSIYVFWFSLLNKYSDTKKKKKNEQILSKEYVLHSSPSPPCLSCGRRKNWKRDREREARVKEGWVAYRLTQYNLSVSTHVSRPSQFLRTLTHTDTPVPPDNSYHPPDSLLSLYLFLSFFLFLGLYTVSLFQSSTFALQKN